MWRHLSHLEARNVMSKGNKHRPGGTLTAVTVLQGQNKATCPMSPISMGNAGKDGQARVRVSFVSFLGWP